MGKGTPHAIILPRFLRKHLLCKQRGVFPGTDDGIKLTVRQKRAQETQPLFRVNTNAYS